MITERMQQLAGIQKQLNEEEYDIIRDLKSTGATAAEISAALRAYRGGGQWKQNNKNNPTILAQEENQRKDVEDHNKKGERWIDEMGGTLYNLINRIQPDEKWKQGPAKKKFAKGRVPGMGWGTYSVEVKGINHKIDVSIKGEYFSRFLDMFGKKKQKTNWVITIKVDGKEVVSYMKLSGLPQFSNPWKDNNAEATVKQLLKYLV